MRNLVTISVVTMLAACADPMEKMPRLADADIPDDADVLSVTPDPATETGDQGGFFSRLFGERPSAETSIDNSGEPAIDTSTEPAVADKEFPPESYGVKSELPEVPRKQGGFLTSLFSNGGKSVETGQIGAGTVLPYGKIASICGLSKRAMGKKVAQHPERRPRHKLYDSEPGNTAPHTFYLTGFGDGCARQFTASVAIFGSVEMHEQLRYGLPAEVQPYSDTDKAYEKVKSRVCGVPRKKPCGNRLGRLENNTVFLSIYENFGGNQRWSNLLLHGGQVVAQDVKG